MSDLVGLFTHYEIYEDINRRHHALICDTYIALFDPCMSLRVIVEWYHVRFVTDISGDTEMHEWSLRPNT